MIVVWPTFVILHFNVFCACMYGGFIMIDYSCLLDILEHYIKPCIEKNNLLLKLFRLLMKHPCYFDGLGPVDINKVKSRS